MQVLAFEAIDRILSFGQPSADLRVLVDDGFNFTGSEAGFLLVCRIESRQEAYVLCLFHAIGLMLELFKKRPNVAAWSNPEAAYSKLGTVRLSRFTVASFMPPSPVTSARCDRTLICG